MAEAPTVSNRPCHPGARTGERGAALLVVLVFAALISSLAAAAIRQTVSGARAASVFLDGMRADELGRAAGDLVVSYIAAGSPERLRGGAFAVQLDTARIAVEYRSESARIDINAAPLPLIAALLNAAGAEPAEAAAAVERLKRLRLPPNRPRTYADGVPMIDSPLIAGRDAPPIQDSHEIASALALSDAVARRALPVLTVASRSGKVDAVLADRLVIVALMGQDSERVDDYLARRTTGFASVEGALDPIPTDTRAFVGFTDGRAIHAVARVTIAGRRERRFDTVIELPDQKRPATRILSWQPLT